MANEVPNFSTITDAQIRSALINERYYSDRSPRWRNQPDSDDAIAERKSRARLFYRHGDRKLARKLGSCKPNARCLSGACPECARAAQRHFVHRTWTLLQPPSDFVVASIVPANGDIRKLSDFSIDEFRQNIGQLLAASNLSFAIGGVDFSHNEHRDGTFPPHWAPHVWLLTSAYNRARWSQILRKSIQATTRTPRPLKVKDWDGKRAAIGYSLKYSFVRRISQQGLRRGVGGVRECRTSTTDRLRSDERYELYSYLDKIGLGARLLLMGVDTALWPVLQIPE